MPSSSSSQAPPTVSQDYAAESQAKFPLPEYPDESKYDDPIVYEADCKWYKVLKLKVLTKHEGWKEREKVADMACMAAAAHEKAEEDKCCHEARDKALFEANKDSVKAVAHPEKCHQAALSSHGESSCAGGESTVGPAPGAVCQCCAQRSGFQFYCSRFLLILSL